MFKKNLTLLSLMNLYVKITGLAVIPFIARRFSVEEFGVLAMAQSILGYALDCFDGGIKKIAIRDLSQSGPDSFGRIVNVVFASRIPLLIFAFFFMNAVGAALFPDPVHRIIILIISISILTEIYDVTWIHDARQDMKPAAIGVFTERTVFLLVCIPAIWWADMDWLALSFPVAGLISGFVIWMFGWASLIRWQSFKFDMTYVREGLVAGFAGVAASLCLTIDQFMISKMMGAYELGLYSAATKVYFVVLTFLWIYAYALFPVLSKFSSNKTEIRRLLTSHTQRLGLGAVVAAGVLCLLAEPLIRLLFSEKFLVVLPVFKLLSVFLMISFFNVIFSDALNAFGKQSQRLAIILKALVLNIVFNVVLIPRYGLLGAVYASIAAQLFVLVFSYLEIKALYQLKAGRYIAVFLLTGLIIIYMSGRL